MTSGERNSEGDHVLELIVRDAPVSEADPAAVSDEIAPLLTEAEKPKINIFTLSYSRRKPTEQVTKEHENEISPVTQLVMWVWSGSRYSGLLCMAVSSTMYFFMEVISNVFSVQSTPLFEVAFARCTVVMVLSYLWLRRSGQPLFGQTHVRKLLVSRAILGLLSMMSFVYCIQRLPSSQAIVLSFTTPIMASLAARIMFHEKLKSSDIGGLSCSFFGVLFIFRQTLTSQGTEFSDVGGMQQVYGIIIGLFSSITGGISYCLIRAGAKASEQPLITVLSFSILDSPVAGIWTLAFKGFVVPGFYSFLLMLVRGILAFFAEVFLARGFQIEQISIAANVQYFEVALTQIWAMAVSWVSPSIGRIAGCLLILVSLSCTICIGPNKEIEV